MMQSVIRKEIVARSFATLRKQKTHTLFAGYLYLQQRSCLLNRLDDLQPEFLPFFKNFFEVGNHPLGTPYIKPFTEQKASEKNLWLNANVAGSYAPSSLRPDQPFRKVVSIAERNYSLPINHADLAYEHLLYKSKIDITCLASFLYRDYGFFGESLSVFDLVNVFSYEFGYSSQFGGEHNKDFYTLFRLDSANGWEDDWLGQLL